MTIGLINGALVSINTSGQSWELLSDSALTRNPEEKSQLWMELSAIPRTLYFWITVDANTDQYEITTFNNNSIYIWC